VEVGSLPFSLFIVDFSFVFCLDFSLLFTGEEALGELVCERLVFML
jgi:hypothetical protein